MSSIFLKKKEDFFSPLFNSLGAFSAPRIGLHVFFKGQPLLIILKDVAHNLELLHAVKLHFFLPFRFVWVFLPSL